DRLHMSASQAAKLLAAVNVAGKNSNKHVLCCFACLVAWIADVGSYYCQHTGDHKIVQLLGVQFAVSSPQFHATFLY
ncbi:MAG: hypothetical protein ACK2UJ_17610, partial [Candidatus Promineifilaceae bacterium]